MPEFKEAPSDDNSFNVPDMAPEFSSDLTEIAKLRAMDMADQYSRTTRKNLGRGFIEFEADEPSEPANEELNETELAPSSVSSEEKLAHLVDDVYGRKGVERFKELVSEMDNAAVSEQDKEGIRHFGEYHLWAMGEHEGAPPESVAVVRDQFSSLLTVEPNPQVLTDADEERILKKYNNAEADFYQHVYWERVNPIYDNRREIIKGLEEIVADSPAYKFFKSLTIENPNDPQDRPLNNVEQAARQSQAEQETKRQFGMSPNDNVGLNPNAARALQRKNFSIGEEQVTEKTITSADSSLEPINRYFVDLLSRRISDRWGQSVDEPMELFQDPDGHIALRPENPELRKKSSFSFNSELVANDAAESFNSEGLDVRIDQYVVSQTLYCLSSDAEFESADQLLDLVRSYIASNVFEDLTAAPSAPHLTKSLNGVKVYDRESYDQEEKLHNSYNKTLENAEQRMLDWSFGLNDHGMAGFPERSSSGPNERPADFNSDSDFGFKGHESIEADKRKIIGNVMGFQVDGVKRLIQTVDRKPGLPPASGNADLVFITDNSSGFSNQQPQIPGFALKGRTKNVYEFVKDTDDPYAACNIEIPLADRQVLADEYQALGLDKLAREVTRNERFTVNNLATAVKNNGEYFTPDESVKISASPEFGEFHNFVDDGKLQLQCSGAGHFLKLSLHKVFGQESAEVIGGLSFDSNEELNLGSMHAQTEFEHNGQKYILDATPSLSAEMSPSHVEHNRLARMPETISERTPEEKLKLQFNRLEVQLCNVFKTLDTVALHTQLSTLPDHDPARRALEITAGLNSSQDAAEYLEYVESIKQAVINKDPQLKQLGIGKYSPELLELLSSQVKKSQALLTEMGR